jgi:hypothetical protein
VLGGVATTSCWRWYSSARSCRTLSCSYSLRSCRQNPRPGALASDIAGAWPLQIGKLGEAQSRTLEETIVTCHLLSFLRRFIRSRFSVSLCSDRGPFLFRSNISMMCSFVTQCMARLNSDALALEVRAWIFSPFMSS